MDAPPNSAISTQIETLIYPPLSPSQLMINSYTLVILVHSTEGSYQKHFSDNFPCP